MADVTTDIGNLVTEVSAVTVDVAAVLAQLKAAPNITPDQVSQLEAQIAALGTVDASLKAALSPAPPPTPPAS